MDKMKVLIKGFHYFSKIIQLKFHYKIIKCCNYIVIFDIFLIYNTELFFSFFVFPVLL